MTLLSPTETAKLPGRLNVDSMVLELPEHSTLMSDGAKVMVADAAVIEEATATARRIAAGAPLVARWHKQWIARLLTGEPLSEQEKRDSFAFLSSADYAEGLAAFSEKRPPKFVGK